MGDTIEELQEALEEKKDIEEVQEILATTVTVMVFLWTPLTTLPRRGRRRRRRCWRRWRRARWTRCRWRRVRWTRLFPATHLFFSQKQQCKHLKASRKRVKPKKTWLRRWVRSRMMLKTNNVLWKRRRRRVWRKKTMVRM